MSAFKSQIPAPHVIEEIKKRRKQIEESPQIQLPIPVYPDLEPEPKNDDSSIVVIQF